jgi:PPK2 family polyphosphate:nucleotide phosphotransferase
VKKTDPKGMRRLVERYRVASGKGFRLKDCDPADTAGLSIDSQSAKDRLQQGVERLGDLQGKLYAQDRWAVLIILQAMDADGKDGTIKHVMSGINPQGVEVHPFGPPSAEELDHNFLWRSARKLPERGRIGIFNRSYYEEVLVVRVHRELLEAEKLPRELIAKDIWEERYQDLNAFERHLHRNGFLVLKFFLNVSRKEQKRRLLARLDDPKKNWKFSAQDVRERGFWKDYMRAYEDMIRATSTKRAPWHVIPADNKWFTRIAVAETVIEALEALDLKYPRPDRKRLDELRKLRGLLK